MRVQCKSSHWQMFIKIGVTPATLFRRDSNTGVFLWNLRKIKSTLFYRASLLLWLLLAVNYVNQWKHTLRFATLLKKKGSGTGVSLWILQNFQRYLFYRTPLDDSFWLFPATLLNWGNASSLKLKVKTVVQRCSVKKVFLEISLNSQENLCQKT